MYAAAIAQADVEHALDAVLFAEISEAFSELLEEMTGRAPEDGYVSLPADLLPVHGNRYSPSSTPIQLQAVRSDA